jgi:uncharacterized delta-60 repeat protein
MNKFKFIFIFALSLFGLVYMLSFVNIKLAINAYSDGSLDLTFDPGVGANNTIVSIDLQSDQKVLIAGDFTTISGSSRNRVARLNNDGTLDTTFNPGTGANSTVNIVLEQPDGKILIAGSFTSYNGTTSNRIARLNSDGSLDTSFNISTGAGNTINAMVLQPDGKILIGGSFTTYAGTSINRIARLNTDGTLDSTFNPGTGANSTVRTFAVQPDGKIIVGGSLLAYNGTSRIRLARINSDGSLDTTFNPGTGANSTIWTMSLRDDGKLFIGGAFDQYNSVVRNNIARDQ